MSEAEEGRGSKLIEQEVRQAGRRARQLVGQEKRRQPDEQSRESKVYSSTLQ